LNFVADETANPHAARPVWTDTIARTFTVVVREK
jgi:hypothetical protein